MTLLAAATRLAPDIAARAAETEAARRLPASLAAEIAAAGLFRMMVPRALGGGETAPADMMSVLTTLAAADAATAWCTMIAANTALAAAYLPAPHAAEVFGNPLSISGGVFAPNGTAVCDGDDYIVSGRWAWASGSANCNWLVGGALVFEDGVMRTLPEGGPDHRMMIFRREDVELIDTWDASGMRGTGSGDMAVNGVRVPKARTVSFLVDTPVAPGPLYAFPPFALLALGIAAVASGNARGALDDFRTLAVAKKGGGSSRSLAERHSVQSEFARAEASLAAAQALVDSGIAAAWALVLAGRPIDITTRARLRLAATHLTRTAADVTRMAYDMAGGSAVYAGSPLQRRFRDAHVATQHMMVAPATFEVTGRVLLGLPTNDRAL